MRNTILEALADNIAIDHDKCLYCGTCVETCILDNLRMKLAPCRQACPLGVNVQGYVQEIKRGRDDKAREIMRDKLFMPQVLGRVCPAPCQDSCHHAVMDGQAVSARALKRYLFEGRGEEDIPLPQMAQSSGKQVAVVGSGPAGLQAAHDLLLAGHRVEIFEAQSQPGGMLRWGIPEYRLPTGILETELSLLTRMGAVFHCGAKLGRDITLAEMQKHFEAVVLATGCPESFKLQVEGEDLEGVLGGLELLRAARGGEAPQLSGKVVVIGGGNAAVDAASVALRLGADRVTLVSLEADGELPAFAREVETAKEEGVVFLPSWGAVKLLSSGGKVTGLELMRCTSVYDASGAFMPEFDDCQLNDLEADYVIVAIGQHRGEKLFSGLSDVDPLTLQSGESNLFLAGDCQSGPSSVVRAMASGREAAESVKRLLAGEHLRYGRSYAGPVETEFDIDTKRGSDAKQVRPAGRSCRGAGDFGELEYAYSEEQARTEAGRCYSCGSPFGKYRTCWFCLPCEVECPEDALWVEIPYLLR